MPELSKYTALGQNKVHNFKTKQDYSKPCGSCSSFSESKSVKFSKESQHLKNWIAYNTKYFRYIYIFFKIFKIFIYFNNLYIFVIVVVILRVLESILQILILVLCGQLVLKWLH